MSELVCPDCGWMVDTRAHELGCPRGRRERRQLAELAAMTRDFIELGAEDTAALVRLKRALDRPVSEEAGEK